MGGVSRRTLEDSRRYARLVGDIGLNKRVAMVVNSPYRDLPGLVLLATRLCQEGVTCFLIPGNWKMHPDVWALAPDFVLLDHLSETNARLARNLSAAGIRFGLHDNEGGVPSDPEMYARLAPDDQELRDRLASFCGWGPHQAEYVRDRGLYNGDRVTVTGSLRFDFYAPQWREAALKMSQYADDYRNNLVLINSTFARNIYHNDLDATLRRLARRPGWDEARARNFIETDFKGLRELAALAGRLARRFPEATFVYRPHPLERMEAYETLIERLPNLHLLKVGTVDGWLLRAKALIHLRCGTAIEGGMAGIPALTPNWIESMRKLPHAEAVSHLLSEDELFDAVSAALTGEFEVSQHIRNQLDEIVGEWYFRIDGMAHERIAQEILKVLAADGDGPDRGRCEAHLYGTGGNASGLTWRKLPRTVWKRLRLPPQWSIRKRRLITHDVHPDKAYDDTQVRLIAEKIYRSVAGSGSGFAPVQVRMANRSSGDYTMPYWGSSVAVSPQ